MPPRLDDIRPVLERHDQAHVLRFWDDLDPFGRQALLAQLASIDFDALDALIERFVRRPEPAALPASIEPAPYYACAGSMVLRPQPADPSGAPAEPGPGAPAGPTGPYDPAHFYAEGEALLRAGKVAAFTVAGGQGTRLGWNGPKGTYPATVVTGKPLFRVFAEQIIASERRYGAPIPWYIMTSPENDAETRAFFVDNNCFGLPRTNVFMFPQGQMPSLDATTGRILLAERHALAMNPDGHGGALKAIRASGALADMRARGIEQVSYFQVDNPTVRVLDPLFLGLHAAAPDSSGEMSSKMVEKTEPAERVGVFARMDHDGAPRTGVIEYSDLPEDLAEARDDDGHLRFRAGSIAIHVIAADFIERLTDESSGIALPFHRAVKKVRCVDEETGRSIEPAEPNGVKLETFVFDALPLAAKSIIYETDRIEEFAPIKNARGGDSPATSHQLQTERAARWLEAHGVAIPRDDEGRVTARIEISPLTALEPGDLVAVDLPARIAAGDEVVL